jgi:hypothetical protein
MSLRSRSLGRPDFFRADFSWQPVDTGGDRGETLGQ